jgi:hypothetical protein
MPSFRFRANDLEPAMTDYPTPPYPSQWSGADSGYTDGKSDRCSLIPE